MITTDFVSGSPCWIELGASDLQRSLDFYHGLFGWQAESAGPDTGGYMILRSGGKAVGGAAPLMEEGQPPAWSLYFQTDDTEATTRTVTRLGGTVHVGPMDVMGMGVMAHYSDPQGSHFAAWQPLSFPGLEAVDEPNSLMWVELWTPDGDAGRAFYAELFGWEFEAFPLPEDQGTYWVLTPAGAGADRGMGGLMPAGPEMLGATQGRGDWHPVFHVEDPEAVTARVGESGGTVYMGPEEMPGVGRLSACADPDGNTFVLLKPSPM
ncbi:VOC family protein [Nocardiopsis sp. YSL2]|uniref:VOC family protein n=1 Tax=Nocardiopsis sp. YSL2 TaxID=2939492 RepID=UPI0026F469F2|nr:VOC family protein [Nocardiopsis sp. YSL2]